MNSRGGMRALLMLVGVVVAVQARAEVKPAAVQVCVELPPGEALFSTEAGPFKRALGPGTWMMDLDVRFDGVAPERLTRAKGDCLRAWLGPRKVRSLEVSFERVPHNLVAAKKDVSLELKPDLFYDAGAVAIAQRPFSTITVGAAGTLTLERQTASGAVAEQPSRLPIGQYRVTFTPAPSPKPCQTQLEVLAMGTVTKERQPALLAELTEHYEKELLPEVLKKFSMTCTDAEVAMVQTRLVDGVFSRPYEPRIEKRRLADREPRLELRHGSERRALDEKTLVSIEAGEQLELVVVPPESSPGPALAAQAP